LRQCAPEATVRRDFGRNVKIHRIERRPNAGSHGRPDDKPK
jgi:hypothetical protein